MLMNLIAMVFKFAGRFHTAYTWQDFLVNNLADFPDELV